jgi:hypothetical protein
VSGVVSATDYFTELALGRAGFLREFRPDARVRHTIRLTYEGCRAIEQNAALAAPLGIETGGYCWSRAGIGSREATVDYVTGPPARSRHAPHLVNFCDPDESRAEFPDFIDPDSMRRVADWHTHPTGDPQPSEVDQNGWAGYLWRNDRACAFETAGLIVTPAHDGNGAGLGVELHGWWTHRIGPGAYEVVPATVVQPRY